MKEVQALKNAVNRKENIPALSPEQVSASHDSEAMQAGSGAVSVGLRVGVWNDGVELLEKDNFDEVK